MRTCIVTSDLAGPMKNGGIGTHCLYLAQFLRNTLRHDVTVLLTARPRAATLRTWRKHYRRSVGIELVGLSDVAVSRQPLDKPKYPLLHRSRRVYDWLKNQSFDVCHFQDWQPDGFVSIQAKRTGQAFQRTLLTFTMHSSAEWSRQGMRTYAEGWTQTLAHDYMERYCAEHADLLLSPSQYMLDWAIAHDWKLANQQVVPYLLDFPSVTQGTPFVGEHVIFFGRLETRKGLALFIQALEQLRPEMHRQERRLKITFLGRASLVNDQPASRYFANTINHWRDVYDSEILSELDHQQALQYLREHAGALVVVPSLVDNSPYTVIESLELRLNLIASRVGGIPELVAGEDILFAPRAGDLCAKLRSCLREGVPASRPRLDRQACRDAWRRIHETAAQEVMLSPAPRPHTPLVSVCIAHFNYGQYLPHTLESLQRQTYHNFEVIAVDDGSTDPTSLQSFEKLQAQYESDTWRFYQKPNGYLGQTRNFAARQAVGQLLVFMDADNVAAPDMLERMVRAQMVSGAACLTCHYLAFASDAARVRGDWTHRTSCFGPCLELAVYRNVVGDANFIVQRDAFDKMGGFSEDRDLGCEDWEFLLKLTVNGFTVDVIPEPLFYYRSKPDSMVRTMDLYASHQRALRPVLERLDPWQRRFVQNAIGSHKALEADLPRLARVHRRRQKSSWAMIKRLWCDCIAFCRRNAYNLQSHKSGGSHG